MTQWLPQCWPCTVVLQLIILEAHSRKKAEEAEFRTALAAALSERDAEGRRIIAEYDRVHKHVMRAGAEDTAATEEQVGSGGWLLLRLW